MKKIIFSLFAIAFSQFILAQDAEKESLKKTEEAVAKIGADKPNGWVKKGTFTFLVNQATFNNWLAGGQSNISDRKSTRLNSSHRNTSRMPSSA